MKMNKWVGVIAASVMLTGVLVGTAGAQDATATPTPSAPQSDGVNLTIYNQGTALVQDRRTFNLQQGVSTLNFTDVAASIDATSVSFKSLTDPAGTSVLEQNYVYLLKLAKYP